MSFKSQITKNMEKVILRKGQYWITIKNNTINKYNKIIKKFNLSFNHNKSYLNYYEMLCIA